MKKQIIEILSETQNLADIDIKNTCFVFFSTNSAMHDHLLIKHIENHYKINVNYININDFIISFQKFNISNAINIDNNKFLTDIKNEYLKKLEKYLNETI